jgi:hypothetical protein
MEAELQFCIAPRGENIRNHSLCLFLPSVYVYTCVYKEKFVSLLVSLFAYISRSLYFSTSLNLFRQNWQMVGDPPREVSFTWKRARYPFLANLFPQSLPPFYVHCDCESRWITTIMGSWQWQRSDNPSVRPCFSKTARHRKAR